MTKTVVTSLYDTYAEATRAIRALESAGIPSEDISLIADRESHATSDADDTSSTVAGVEAGASVGAMVGGGAGLLAGLGIMAIPGLGPVVAAGWLAVTALGVVAGAGVGGATGGVVGALSSHGVKEENAHVYAEGVRRGGTLVTVRAEDNRVVEVRAILHEHDPVNMLEREQQYRAGGWTGFESPVTADPRTVPHPRPYSETNHRSV